MAAELELKSAAQQWFAAQFIADSKQVSPLSVTHNVAHELAACAKVRLVKSCQTFLIQRSMSCGLETTMWFKASNRDDGLKIEGAVWLKISQGKVRQVELLLSAGPFS
jgi:hypothetical protein